MEQQAETKSRIDELEKKKAELIERIKKLNRRIRYKKYEQKALQPFLEQTKDIRVAPIRRKKRALEFKISTAAFTPRMEKELVKQLKKIDEELNEVREVEKARRKIKYVEKDITEGEEEISNIEIDLNAIREELRKLYEENKAVRAAARKQAAAEAKAEEDMVSLGELAFIEKDGS